MDTVPATPNASPDAEPPKKYVRTFAGDMESLKRGGTPHLAPLRASVPTPPARTVAPLPAQPVPVETSPPATKPPPAAPEEPRSTPLETYAGDFSDRMKRMQASTATVLAAEQDSAPRFFQAQPKESSRSTLLYSIAGATLIIIGGFGAYVAYTRYLSGHAPVLLAPVAAAPIFVDEREKVFGTGSILLRLIEQLVERPLAHGAVRLMYFEPTTDMTSIFSALQLSAPGILLRNIGTVGSMAGVVNAGGAQSPFFILSVASFGDTFAGMLQWEPFMLRDLTKLFPSYAEGFGGQASVSTTTATTTASTPLFSVLFHDEVVSNHDVRIYRDIEGRSLLLYGYWDQTTLVIARDAAAFTELIRRLATSRAQP